MKDSNVAKKLQKKGGERNMKKDNGITLIALIITIIILVILAAVSIRAVYNMGIVGHAINGTQEYSRGAVAENQMLGDTENTIDNALARLKEIQEASSTTGDEEGTLLAALKAGIVHIGDYINYQAPSVSATFASSRTGAMAYNETTAEYEDLSQTFNVSTTDSEKMGWRILGYGNAQGKLTTNKNEATNVLLIAANPIQQYLVLGKEYAYINGPTVLNDLSSKFGTSGINAATNFTTSQTTARSVNIEDINTALGITVNRTTGKIHQNGTEIQNAYVASGTYDYTETDWEMGESAVSYGTGTGKSVDLDGFYYPISAGDSTDIVGSMLLEGTVKYETETNPFTHKTVTVAYLGPRSYWLASRGIYSVENYPPKFDCNFVGKGGVHADERSFTAEGYWLARKTGVRPVISLASGIQYGQDSGQLTQLEMAPTGWEPIDEPFEDFFGQYEAPGESELLPSV